MNRTNTSMRLKVESYRNWASFFFFTLKLTRYSNIENQQQKEVEL